MSKIEKGGNGCGGMIIGAVLLVLAALPGGIIALVLYFFFRNMQPNRERTAWWIVGISTVLIWGIWFLVERDFQTKDIREVALSAIAIGAICYYIIYLDVKKAKNNPSPNKSITIPLISTIVTIFFMYLVFWKDLNEFTVFSYIVFYGTLFFFLSLFVFGEPKTAKTKTDHTTRVKASPNESAPDVPSSNAKNEYDTSKLTKIEKSYPAIAMTVVSAAGSIIGYFSESILLIFFLAILGGIIGFIFGLWVLSRIIEKKSSPTYNISTKPSHNSNNYKPKTSLNQMKPSQENTFNFSIPPEDFDAKFATELTEAMRKVFSHFSDEDNINYLNLTPSIKNNVIAMLDLMGNSFKKLTDDYFETISSLASLEQNPPVFNVEICENDYIKEDYMYLVDLLKSNINNFRESQISYFQNKHKKYKRISFLPSSFEFVFGKIKFPENIEDKYIAASHFQGLEELYEYFVKDDFDYFYSLFCLARLKNHNQLNEFHISQNYETLKALRELHNICLESINSLKETAKRVKKNIEQGSFYRIESLSRLAGKELVVFVFNNYFRKAKNKLDVIIYEEFIDFSGNPKNNESLIDENPIKDNKEELLESSERCSFEKDDFFEDAAFLVVTNQQGSTSLIQRKLKLGYNRAGRIMDQLEAAGIVGPFDGSSVREVYIKDEDSLIRKLRDIVS